MGGGAGGVGGVILFTANNMLHAFILSLKPRPRIEVTLDDRI